MKVITYDVLSGSEVKPNLQAFFLAFGQKMDDPMFAARLKELSQINLRGVSAASPESDILGYDLIASHRVGEEPGEVQSADILTGRIQSHLAKIIKQLTSPGYIDVTKINPAPPQSGEAHLDSELTNLMNQALILVLEPDIPQLKTSGVIPATSFAKGISGGVTQIKTAAHPDFHLYRTGVRKLPAGFLNKAKPVDLWNIYIAANTVPARTLLNDAVSRVQKQR